MDILAVAERIRSLREDLDISTQEMADFCGISEVGYLYYEAGKFDYSFSFLSKCAARLGVDVSELVTGANTGLLKGYAVERKGKGLPLDRREGFRYLHLASRMEHRKAEPLFVSVPFDKEALSRPIPVNTHAGQEFDYVLSGTMKITVGGREEILSEGDSILYDSTQLHGMIALSESGLSFLAFLVK